MAEENVVSRIRYLPIYDKAAPPPYSRINPSTIAQDRKLSASLGNLSAHTLMTSCSYADVRDMCSRNTRRASKDSSGMSYEIKLMSGGKLRGICEEAVRSRIEGKVENGLLIKDNSLPQDDVNTNKEFCSTCKNFFTNADEVVEAAGKQFHTSCFICHCCGMNLCQQPFTVDINNNIYCIADFISTYAPKCSACCTSIHSNDQQISNRVVTEADSFHLQCFSCQICRKNCSQSSIPFCYKIGVHLVCLECFQVTQSKLLTSLPRESFPPSTRFHFWTAAVPEPLQFSAKIRKVELLKKISELGQICQKDSLLESRNLLPQRAKPIRRKHRTTDSKLNQSRSRNQQNQLQQPLSGQHGIIKQLIAGSALQNGSRLIDIQAQGSFSSNNNGRIISDSSERFKQNLVPSDRDNQSSWAQFQQGDQTLGESRRYPYDWSESSSAQDTSCDEYSSDADTQSQLNSNASCSSIDSGMSSYLGSQAPSDTSASSPRALAPRRRSSDRFTSSDFDVVSVDRLSTIYDNQLSNSDRSATPTEFNVFDADESELTSTLTHSSSGKSSRIVEEEANEPERNVSNLDVANSAMVLPDAISKDALLVQKSLKCARILDQASSKDLRHSERASPKGVPILEPISPSSLASSVQISSTKSSFVSSTISSSTSIVNNSVTMSSTKSTLKSSDVLDKSSSVISSNQVPLVQKRSSESVQTVISRTQVSTSRTLPAQYSQRSSAVKSVALPVAGLCSTAGGDTISNNSTSSGSSVSGLSIESLKESKDYSEEPIVRNLTPVSKSKDNVVDNIISRELAPVSTSKCDTVSSIARLKKTLPIIRLPEEVEQKSMKQQKIVSVKNLEQNEKQNSEDKTNDDLKYKSIEEAYKEMGYKITFL